MKRKEILKKLSRKFLIDKKDKKLLEESLQDKIKKDIERADLLLNNLYLEKMLLENDITIL